MTKTKIEALQKTEVELKEKLVEDSRTTVKMEEMSGADAPANNAAIDSVTSVMSCDELMERILSLLYCRDLKSAVEVCKRWNTIGEGTTLWKWVKLRVTEGNLTNMPVILGSRLAKVEEIILDKAISKEVLLTIEKHQGLNVLRVSECNVSDIDSDLLVRVITGIEEVSLEYTKLDAKQWNAIFNSTKGAKLKKLSIIAYEMVLPPDNPQLLAEAVSTLEKVKLTCGLTTEQSKAMFDHLAVKSNLKSLEIMCTDFSSVAVQTLAMVVSQVEEADLYFSRLTIQQIRAIFNKATEEVSKLKVLNLRLIKNLSQVDPDVMATAVNKLEKVGLSCASLNATQCSAIFGLAAGKSKIKDLDISSNDLSSVNKHNMARAVNNMEKIDLRWTELTNQQCIQIIEYAEDEINLKVLKIGHNDLRAVEPGSMARAVIKMEECSLKCSKLTNQQAEDIIRHINEDCKLKKLDMFTVNLSSLEADIIAKAIDNLGEVDLSYIRLNTVQLEAIFMVIRRGSKIKILKLRRENLLSVQTETLVGRLLAWRKWNCPTTC